MPSVNLHTHSVFSDGTLAPRDVLKRAQNAGVEFFSLTDHDTVDSWRNQNYSLSDYKLKIVRGIEISTSFHDNLHILGYGIDVENENLLLKLTEYKHRSEEHTSELQSH